MERSEEEREKKVRAGRAKLANFRQRKTKGQGTNTQKKTPKRKSATVHTHDVPKEENTLVTAVSESGAGDTLSEVLGFLSVSECEQRMSDLEANHHVKRDAACSDEVLDQQVHLRVGPEPLQLQQELQTAVLDRNDIIAQLSRNLQQALENRDEMEGDAQLLSSQIQALQLQLQEVSEVLKSKSSGTTEVCQAGQLITVIQNNIHEQTGHMSEPDQRAQDLEGEPLHKNTKENENQMAKLEDLIQEKEKKLEALQEKLQMSEVSVSTLQQALSARDQEVLKLRQEVHKLHVKDSEIAGGDSNKAAGQDSINSLTSLIMELKEKLQVSEALRQDLGKKLDEQMSEFQSERESWEKMHKGLVEKLTVKVHYAEMQAEEAAAQAKHDKEHLNAELRALRDQLQLEAQTSQTLKMQHDQVLQTYELKLRCLEKESEKMYQDSSNAKSDDPDKVSGEQPHQEEGDSTLDNFKHELEDLKKSLSRVKARKECDDYEAALLHMQGGVTEELDSMEMYLLPSHGQLLEHSATQEGFSEHSLFELDSDFVVEQSLSSSVEGNTNFLCSPMPITGVLAGAASAGTLLDPESFAVYLSSNIGPPEEEDVSVLCDENLAQKCTVLMKQLQDKEQQLQKCSHDLEETFDKWRQVTTELSAAQLQEHIRDRDWKEQQRILHELQHERERLKMQIKEQEQLLREAKQQHVDIEELHYETDTLKRALSAKEECVSQLVEEKKNLQERLSNVEQTLTEERAQNSHRLQEMEQAREVARQEFTKGLEYQTLSNLIKEKEAEFTHRERSLCEKVSALKQVQTELENRLQEQEYEGELSRASHQEELLRVCSDFSNEKQQLLGEKQQLLGELQQLRESHHSQTEQAQAAHHVELEALRLSLTNMHAAHLELSQANLHREQEEALVELRNKLNDQRAQEVAFLQGRHQSNMEHVQSQHTLELEVQREKSSREMEQIKERYHKEMERMGELHTQEHEESYRCQVEPATALREDSEPLHQPTVENLQDQPGKERESDNEISKLIYQEVKLQSRNVDLQALWEQLDGRQHLYDMKEQLLSRSAHVDEVARMKKDFQHQRLLLKSDHERELEELRIYFEEKSRETEENYREELEMLHLRLREKEDDREEPAQQVQQSSNVVLHEQESERSSLLQHLTDQLARQKEELSYLQLQAEDKHKLDLDTMQAALSLQYREDLVNMKMELSDRFISEIEALKKKHCLELEQLRAKLSEEHIREITKLHLQNAQESAHHMEALKTHQEKEQVVEQLEGDQCSGLEQRAKEEELDARVSELQKQQLDARVSELQKHHDDEQLGARVSELQKHHEEELDARVSELQKHHEEELDARVSELQKQHEEELDARVSELQKHHEEELDARVSELQKHHEEELDARVSELQKHHEEQLDACVSELQKQHEEELDARVSELQKHHEEELNARVSELQKHHEEELDARVSELQKQQLDARVSELQKHHDDEQLGARVSELQKHHEEELDARVSELQKHNEEELDARVSELQKHHEEELDARVSELQKHHEEQLDTRVSELQKQHEEELDARVSELQKHHEEELDTRVSELQKHHEEELDARVSKLQKHHEEEQLDARVSELQKHHEEELDARVSELQKHHEEDLDARVSELQKHHEEELDAHLSEILKNHEEELNTSLSELQKHHEEELGVCISELQRQHKIQVAELEAIHLSKMDTLESSYITQIHTIQDEHKRALVELETCLNDKLLEKEKEMQEQLAQVKVTFHSQMEQELQLARELLRKELTIVHMGDIRTITEELETAHTEDLKVRLDEQRMELEKRKCQALDALREEVLHMEEQNQRALQQLHDLHTVGVQQNSVEQEELRKQKEQLREYELIMAELKTQLLALSNELLEKSDQQLRFQEEIELLKCQSEMLLEQQISQLKDEFETEKKIALQEKEELHTRETETLKTAHSLETTRMQILLDEKSSLVLELQDKVSLITKDMAASGTQLEMLVQRRDRENQEAENLVEMLRSDVLKAQQEQRRLQDSSQRLLKLFTEVLRSVLSTEDLISKKIGLCLDSSLSQDEADGVDAAAKPWDISLVHKLAILQENKDEHRVSPDCDTMTENSLMSSDEGYELSEYLCDTVLGTLELGLDTEQKILRISQRMQNAVARLLDLVAESTSQVEQTREIQHRFEEEFNSRNQETAQMVIQNQDLVKQLAQETEAKNRLQVELHKAQGLIDGFSAEKASLEEALSGKECAERRLVVELEVTREQLKVLSQETTVLEGGKLLLRLQEVLSGNVQDMDLELLKETERLAREKLELHCQAKKDRSNLLSQMKVLEMELEEQMSRNQELLKRTNDVTDLQQQIQSLEKQLRNQRHFMDEQAVEREHERDDFQQEIGKLEEQLKQVLKNQPESRTYGLQEWNVQLETLEAEMKEKVADCSLLLQGKSDLEQQVVERNHEIDKMLGRIQELEQAALSNEEAAKKCTWLEAEHQRVLRREKELVQDKEALQQQQYNSALQISALQSKLDEARHWVPMEGEPGNTFKEQLEAEREALLRKEKEAESLVEQLEQFKEALMNKTEEILQLNMQLEIQRAHSDLAMQQVKESNSSLQIEVSSLQQLLNQQNERSCLQLPQALLLEKNQEIDHLNEQLARLEREVAESQNAEIEDLRSLVEHLRSDQERLQKDKEEEVERLHEVIEKLQNELEQLGPNRHEVSDSQESLDQLGLGEVENLQKELRKEARQAANVKKLDQECPLQEDFQENARYHSEVEVLHRQLEEQQMLHNPEVEALRQQMQEQDTLHRAEMEVLKQNLHNLKSSNHQVQQQSGVLEERDLLTTHLSQIQAEVTHLSFQLQETEDLLRQKDACLMEKELLIQTLQEQSAADLSNLEGQLLQRDALLEISGTELQELSLQKAALQELLDKSSREQSQREEHHQEVKRRLRDWEDKAQTLTEELQRLEKQSQLLSAPDSNPHLIALKEQLAAVETLAMERASEQLRTEGILRSVRRELVDLKAECGVREARGQAEVQTFQSTLVCQEATMKQSDLLAPITSFTESLPDMSAWESPEMVRKQEELVHSLRGFTTYSDFSIAYSADLDYVPSKSYSHLTQSIPCDLHDVGICTPSSAESDDSLEHNTHRTSPLGDTVHTQTDSTSSEFQRRCSIGERTGSAQPRQDEAELPQHVEWQQAPCTTETGHSAQLQNMLQLVHEESCKILALSEHAAVTKLSPQHVPPVPQWDAWKQEKQALQNAIESLRSALTQEAARKEKDAHEAGEDWRAQLLHSVQEILASERQYLELHSQLAQHGSGDKGFLLERLEHVVREQEEQKRLIMEHLLASDRSSLLSEIQDLQSQLRISHLQNQEKLQQLQESLSATEEKGGTKEHQLRRKVELLEYKLQQEASIADDLKASLTRETDRASEQHKLLLAEQGLVCELRNALDRESLEREQLRMEVSQLRDDLKTKEEAVTLYVQTLKRQQEQENRRAEEQKVLVQQIYELKEKTLQELSGSLEEQRMQNNQLSVALKHEQSCNSNLRKELQIEQSRYEALLAQELRKLSEAEQELAKEKQHTEALCRTLTQKHGVVDQLHTQHTQELARREQERLQEHSMVLTLQSQLEEERSRSSEFAAMLEKTQQQTISAKRQLEAELQASRNNSHKEQESNAKLRATLESLQSQKRQLESTLERQRERECCLQREREEYQEQLLILQKQDRVRAKESEKERKSEQQAECKREERERRILDLQLQHERDQHRIQDLQNMLADLEEQEHALASRRAHLQSQVYSPESLVHDIRASYRQDSANVWQQVLHTILQVKEWIQSRSCRIPSGSLGDEALNSLLDTLAQLQLVLLKGLKPPAQSSSSLMDVLLSENRALTHSVTLLTKEKLELRSQVSRLSHSQQGHSAVAVDSAFQAERSLWNKEKHLLQSALKRAESELSKVVSERENRPVTDASNPKMQRLYRRYLRAESFRKALVYQKKYLLLLLGGFQACEKATLSLIARMGVFPSPADLDIPTTCHPGITKFRSAAKAIIAISRLKFLVRKWQKGHRKGGEATAQGSALLQQGSFHRTDVLRQQLVSSIVLNSPPTRDATPKPSYYTPKRLGASPSLNAGPDSETSLSKYIQHLEKVQERLGGLPSDSSPDRSHLKYAWQ